MKRDAGRDLCQLLEHGLFDKKNKKRTIGYHKSNSTLYCCINNTD